MFIRPCTEDFAEILAITLLLPPFFEVAVSVYCQFAVRDTHALSILYSQSVTEISQA
jgi:hypothetical protein